MNILYDYQGFVQHHGGVSRYHVELIKNLRKHGHKCCVPFLLSENIYLNDIEVSHAYPFGKCKTNLMVNVYKWIDQRLCLHAIDRGEYDVFHPTFFNPYFVGHCKKPIVVTMHDLNHWKYPELTVKAEIVQEKERIVCNAASHIIAISEETKEDLMKYLHIPEKKITVIYHGINQKLVNSHDEALFKFPYLLYIGGRSGYKNFKTLLQAFTKIDKNINLVCTGAVFNTEEKNIIEDFHLSNRIHQMFVNDNDLNNLLSNAIAFVYPSLAEGFGMPILEAFRCGCPCIISDLKCFKEVAGDAALYFNPTDIDDIAHIINETVENDCMLRYLKTKGYERMQMFSWKKTAAETENVYHKLLNK